MFNVHVKPFIEVIWSGLRDAKVYVREASVDALRVRGMSSQQGNDQFLRKSCCICLFLLMHHHVPSTTHRPLSTIGTLQMLPSSRTFEVVAPVVALPYMALGTDGPS